MTAIDPTATDSLHTVRELLLGIDIGTASSKGVLVRADGTILATAQRPHRLALPRPGWAEHDALDVWWADVVALCGELVPRAEGRLAGVAVSGIGPCLLPVDAADVPLRPAILYGIDTRATAEIADLTKRYGAAAILARGGSALTSQAVGPKLLWLQRHEPELWARTARFYMASSFAVRRLTGAYVLDHHSASQCDPLYDLDGRDWAADWAAEIAPGLELPRLVWPAAVVGTVTTAAAAETGLPAGTPVVAGTIDAWAEAVSVGVRRPGDLMLMYGTTMFLVEVVDRTLVDPRLWATAGPFEGTTTLGAGLATSGALTGWFREIAGGPPFEQLIEEAARVEPGSEGLVVLPYFAGERTPIHDPEARGVIAGLTLRHGRGHLYRALLEGTAYAVRHNLEVFGEIGAAPLRVVAVGGGTAGDLWTQIVSDVTGREQELPAETVGAGYGDAFLAAIGTGLARPDDVWNPIVRRVVPHVDRRTAYDAGYDVYRSLYPATREQMHALARAQAGVA
ncbi:MAG TPA: FGGY-family carbohydrate kinase [Candidatus Saccharimonadales bacterium]|nr:FGGY-family carbohydrate kinase [Candidatus Saccharimonadales bacterium]